MLNGIELAGRDLRVDTAQRKEDRPARDSTRPPRTDRRTGGSDQKNSVFLGNLAWDVTTELVEDMINDVLGPGLFTQVRLAVERDTGKMRGFGHIDFKDAASAERCVAELNGMQVMGRQIRVDFAAKKDSA
jgi:nucleolin